MRVANVCWAWPADLGFVRGMSPLGAGSILSSHLDPLEEGCCADTALWLDKIPHQRFQQSSSCDPGQFDRDPILRLWARLKFCHKAFQRV